MRKGFWNGLLAGGLIGAVTAMVVRPQYKRTPKKGVMGKITKMQSKASRMAKEVNRSYKNIKDLMD